MKRIIASHAQTALAVALLTGAASGCTLVESPDDYFLEVPASEECQDYCTRYLALCSGDAFNEYTDEPACLSTCSGMVPGSDLDYERNTLSCRLNHLAAAESIDAGTHCAHASASGGTVCVRDEPTPCESFCGIYQERCTGNFVGLDPDGEGGVSAFFNCVTLCNATDDSTMAEAGAFFGQKLGCFESYLNLSQSQGDDFCVEASPRDSELCADDTTACDAFCGVAEELCGEALTATFGDEDACLLACNGGDPTALLPGIDAMANEASCDPVTGGGSGACVDDRANCFPNEM